MENVEGGAGDLSGLKGFGQVRLDHQFTAGAVHDADALLHGREHRGVNDAGGLRRQADVEGEVVRHCEQLLSRNQTNRVFARDRGRDKRVVAEEFHAELAGDFETDAAEAEDAEFLAAQLGALEGFLFPFAGVHRGVGARKLAGERDHQSEGELRDGNGVRTRRVHDDDAAAGGGFGVDVVYADSGTADDAEFGGGGHEGVVDLDGGADNEGVSVGEGFREVLHLVVGQDLPSGFGLKDSEGGRRDFFREDDFHDGSFGTG